MKLNSKAPDYFFNTPFEPSDIQRPPPYNSPLVDTDICHHFTNNTNVQVAEQQQIVHHDIEAGRGGGTNKKRQRDQWAVIRHKILIISLMTFFLLLFLRGLSEPDRQTQGKLKVLFEKDLGLELAPPERDLTKICTTMTMISWFLVMSFAVIFEKHSILVFCCVMAVIIQIVCVTTNVLMYLASPQTMWLATLLMTCFLAGLMINSMIYLVKTIERDV